jgi:hypothetical protein
VIVEATDQIGGRGNTDSTTVSAPIDLGGAWIHNVKTNPLTPIILGSGYATQPTDVAQRSSPSYQLITCLRHQDRHEAGP